MLPTVLSSLIGRVSLVRPRGVSLLRRTLSGSTGGDYHFAAARPCLFPPTRRGVLVRLFQYITWFRKAIVTIKYGENIMSLGLFTLDNESNVWFHIDCLGHPHPKHFVYNLKSKTPSERVLVLHTGFTYDPNVVGQILATQHHVRPNDFYNSLSTHLTQHVPQWKDGEQRHGFIRVVYNDSKKWVYDKATWIARKDTDFGNLVSVSVTDRTVSLKTGELICIGEGQVFADTDWRNTVQQPTAARLFSALKAAFDNGAPVCIPSVRQPARMIDCNKSSASCYELF